MYTIDLTLKNSPLTLSVQRKTEEDAQALYQQVRDAIQSGQPSLLELTCDRQTEKKICVLTSELCVVQISQKSGSSDPGRQPGFFAALAEAET